MSALQSYFNDFLSNIRLPDSLREELKKAHTELREHLKSDDITKDLLVDSFLQGSYARATCIKPEKGHKADVDVIVVTNIDHEKTSATEAFKLIMPFAQKYYNDVTQQKRSIGITLEQVDVDLVITAAPSEEVKNEIISAQLSEAFTIDDISAHSFNMNSLQRFFDTDAREKSWQAEPLLIPDTEDNNWHKTHPLEQIRWTRDKNRHTSGHYVNVVKALKWWKRVNMPGVKHPKSYPLEHFIGDCCPNNITSIAEGITKTLDYIVLHYPNKPFLPDRGVPEHDVFETLTEAEYQAFYNAVKNAAPLARKAYESTDVEESVLLWRTFFCDSEEFPRYTGDQSKNGFTPRIQKSETIPTGRFG